MTTPTVEQTPASRSAAGHRRVALALALLAMALLGPVVARHDASSWSRVAFTAALWDDHTVDVSDYPIGADHVEYEGERRSDKAAGQPLLGVPFYAVYRIIGGEPAIVERPEENLGLWWQTLWISVVPFGLLLVLMYGAARRVDARAALQATVAIGFGTLILPFANHLYGHLLSAVAIFGAWLLVRENPSRARALAGGALAGLAAITEYQVALVVAIIAVVVAVHARARLLYYIVGVCPFVLVAGAHHWIAVGSPWRVPYSLKDVHEGGIVGISFPQLRHLTDIVAGDRGFLVATPIVLLAVGAAVALARRPGRWRVDALVAITAFTALVFVQAGGSMPPWGGGSPGPRYVIAALPFLVRPLAAYWTHLRPLTTLVAGWSIAVMLLPTFTHTVLHHRASAIPTWVRLVERGEFTPTLFSIAFGWAGVVVHAVVVCGAIAYLVHARALQRVRFP